MMRKATIFLTHVLLLSSCLRPHYTPQYVDTPEEWRFDADENSTLCNARWWKQFNDPVLNHLILVGLRNNLDLKVAITRVFQYYAAFRVVNANLYPNVTGGGSYNRFETSLVGHIPLVPGEKRIYNNFELVFNLNWELDIWGSIAAASQASYADLLSQVEMRRAVVMTVVRSIANGYITLRQLDAQLEVSKKTLDSRKESLKLAITRFELGETSELEVKQAEAQVEDAAIAVLVYEREIPLQENLLSILLGENPHSIARGSSIDAFNYPPEIPAGLPSDLLTRRPDIMEAEDQLIAANALVYQARVAFFPQFNLTGAYGSDSGTLKRFLTSPAEFWQYGLALLQPIFNAGQLYYQLEEQKAIRDEALFNYRQVILKAFKEVDDALIAYRMNRELVDEHQKQVVVLGQYLHLAQLRYNEGEVDYLNVLDAERFLFQAQLNLVQAQADSFNAVVQLYSALGGGWVDDADTFAINPFLTALEELEPEIEVEGDDSENDFEPSCDGPN